MATKTETVNRLRHQLIALGSFSTAHRASSAFEKWRRDAEVAIANAFGDNTRHLKDFRSIQTFPIIVTSATTQADHEASYKRGIERYQLLLQSFIDEVSEYWPESGVANANAAQIRPPTFTARLESLKNHWLLIVLGLVAAAVGTSWTIQHNLFVVPRDERLVTLQNENDRLHRALELSEKVAIAAPLPSDGTAVESASDKNQVTVDLAAVNTSSAPDMIMPAFPYLRNYGISTLVEAPTGSEVVVINTRKRYEAMSMALDKGANVLTQVGAKGKTASFRLEFSRPLESVTFTRPTLLAASKSGITHPAWTASALDTTGNVLSSVHESINRSYIDVPARSYTLRAPGFASIAAIRFESDPLLDGQPFAAFEAILIEKLVLNRLPDSANPNP